LSLIVSVSVLFPTALDQNNELVYAGLIEMQELEALE